MFSQVCIIFTEGIFGVTEITAIPDEKYLENAQKAWAEFGVNVFAVGIGEDSYSYHRSGQQ